MGPLQSAFRMALSIALTLSHPCSTMTSGKYVAERVCLELRRGKKEEEENGEGGDESAEGYIAGFRKLICIPWTPTVQSRYDDAFSNSVSNEILAGHMGGLERAKGKTQLRWGRTHPHSSKGSSFASIFLKRESLKALTSAYSAMPSRMDMGSKLPMQPLNLGARPGREDLVFQVTKRGLYDGS